MIRVPKGVSSLAEGTKPGTICDQPVNLVSLFGTLSDLAGISRSPQTNAPSLVPLLRDPQATWSHHSTTFLADGGSVGISLKRYRYIRYQNGEEELYDIKKDPFEWTNLVTQENQQNRIQELRKLVPGHFSKLKLPSVKSLPELPWVSEKKRERIPASAPDGSSFECYFINKTKLDAKLHWMDRNGKPRFYALIKPGEQQRQSTRPGAVWMISDSSDRPMGYFRIDDRSARGIIGNHGK